MQDGRQVIHAGCCLEMMTAWKRHLRTREDGSVKECAPRVFPKPSLTAWSYRRPVDRYVRNTNASAQHAYCVMMVIVVVPYSNNTSYCTVHSSNAPRHATNQTDGTKSEHGGDRRASLRIQPSTTRIRYRCLAAWQQIALHVSLTPSGPTQEMYCSFTAL